MQCCTAKKRGRSVPHGGGAADADIALAGGPDDNNDIEGEEEEKAK